MVKESINKLMVKKEKEFGKMGKELGGLMRNYDLYKYQLIFIFY